MRLELPNLNVRKCKLLDFFIIGPTIERIFYLVSRDSHLGLFLTKSSDPLAFCSIKNIYTI